MRHKSNPIKQPIQVNIIEEILHKHQIESPHFLLPDEQSFTYRPRFSKHKNFYTKKPLLELHYVTPTQKHAKEILDKICYIKKKVIQNTRPESSFQKRKEFSVDQCCTTRASMPKRQIRIKSNQIRIGLLLCLIDKITFNYFHCITNCLRLFKFHFTYHLFKIHLMLPMMYNPLLAFHPQFMMFHPPKLMCDKACQFPEIPQEEEEEEKQAAQELTTLLIYLSKNICLLKDAAFEQFSKDHLKILNSLCKDFSIPQSIKKRYLQVNKTKEEMTKFIIRRCFLFIKTQLNYQEQDNLPADERDKLLYSTFFGDDEEYLKILKESHQTIDDMIPLRKDSKMKTMNENYLKILFQSKKFSLYYQKYLGEFKEICVAENQEKIDNMTKQLLKIFQQRDFAKLKSYRRYPWKDHELIKCDERAKELYQKYHDSTKRINQKVLSKNEHHLEKTDISSEKTSEPLTQP